MPIKRSFHLRNNADGTLDSDYPLGDLAAAAPTLQINLTGLQSLVGTQIGSPYSVNIRQFVSSTPNGSYAAAATISFNSHTGDDPAAKGYTAPGTGDNLTCAANVLASGTFDLKAHHASVANDAISAIVPFSVVALSTAAWDWVPANGLNNGDPAGANWAAFNATLNSNPNADGYLQITFSGAYGGVSTNDLLHPPFKNSTQYTAHLTVASGGTHSSGGVSINQGPYTAFSGTGAKTLTVISGVGPNSFVVADHNGTATAGQTLRLSAMDATEDADVVQFDQPAFIGNVGDSTISFTATRVQPSNASQSVTVSIFSGGSFATLNTTTLTWAANVGGQKTGTITPSAPGAVVLQLSAPTIGVLGAQTQTTITISPAAGAIQYPLVSASLLDNDTSLPNPWDTLNVLSTQQYLGKFDFVIVNGVQDAQAWRGSTLESICQAIKSYSTRPNGTRVFMYHGTLAGPMPGVSVGYSQDLVNANNTNNWFLRDTYPSGGVVPSTWNPSEALINNSLYSNLDANGRRRPQFLAYYGAGWVHNGLYSNTASATVDGIFWDDIFMYPQRGGDFDQNGVYDDPSVASVQTTYRQGLASIISTYKTNNSSRLCGANVATMADAGYTNIQTQLPEFWRTLHGGQIEHFWARGQTSSAWWYSSTWAGRWPLIVAHLRNIEDAMLIPQLVGLGGYPSDGNPSSAQSMQEFRYAMAATAILTNMCCHWSDAQNYFLSTFYNLHAYVAGTAVAGSTGTRQAAFWTAGGANGVWRRVFSNGDAYVNPLGNGPLTVSLGATRYVLRGDLTMTAGRTGGAAVTSITLQDGDGCFLSNTPT